LYFLGDQKRREFITKKCSRQLGSHHTIDHENVFQDVMALFAQDEVLDECSLRIKFATEMGYDCGGVCRGMFSAYWNEAYQQFFDGSTLLVPALHPSVNMSALPSLETILSHISFVQFSANTNRFSCTCFYSLDFSSQNLQKYSN